MNSVSDARVKLRSLLLTALIRVPAAIYARVSSDRQREENTIASQTATLIDFARSRGYQVPTEWVFEDEGYSGASLVSEADLTGIGILGLPARA